MEKYFKSKLNQTMKRTMPSRRLPILIWEVVNITLLKVAV